MKNQTLSAERAREIFSYDPLTGVFTRLSDKGCAKRGARADHLRPDGYRRVKADGRSYYAHRVAHLMTYGEWPAHVVDHKNLSKSDNRRSNLRDVPRRVNSENQYAPSSASLSGLRGVSPSFGKFRARITKGGQVKCLGTFNTPEEAHQAYLSAKRELHAGCTV